MMEHIQPWNTTIGRFNVKHQVDLEAIASAILACSRRVNGSFPPIDESEPEAAVLIELRDKHITPRVIEYIRDEFNMALSAKDMDVSTHCVNIPTGGDIESHMHSRSSLTVVMYPLDADSLMILNDPRGAACRGYPRAVVEHAFGNHHIKPRAGDVYIVPSYIQHSVNPVMGELRLSFVNDYFLEPI
ncbi:hypothetical protein D3C78_563510 [compost metagenome]